MSSFRLSVVVIIAERPSRLCDALVSHGPRITTKVANRPNHHYKCINSPLSFALFFLPTCQFFASLVTLAERFWRRLLIAYRLADYCFTSSQNSRYTLRGC